jgi:putative spermidine/putrescine transport system substrate-binding protein
MSIGYDLEVPGAEEAHRPARPDYKGAVAINGDPTQAGAAFAAVGLATVQSGGTLDDFQPGIDFFAAPEGGQPPQGRRDDRHGRPARPPWSSTGTTSTRHTARTTQLEGRRLDGTGYAGYYNQAINKTLRTRPPRACGRSSSTATRCRTSG